MRTRTERGRREWRRRILKSLDLGASRPTPVQRELLHHLTAIQQSIDALGGKATTAAIEARIKLMAAFGRTVDRIRACRQQGYRR